MSSQIVELQKLVGVKADGDFGPITLKAAMSYFKLTKVQAAHFFGQCAHESGEFAVFEENLNYSADGLLKTFKKYFSTKAVADQYARKPEKIANRVYSSRYGNGDEASGDGWKYRGRGSIQLTFKSNYAEFAKFIGDISILNDPSPVANKYAFHSAKFFFDKNGLWALCKAVDDASIKNVTKKVNGGINGLDHRAELTKKYYSWLR